MPPLRSAAPGSGASVRLREEEASVSAEVTPFRIEVPEADLVDLRERLVRTRWPEAETVDDWSQGIPLSYVRDVCRYWAGDYDWRGREAGLNRFPQFRAEVDGLGIHFIHVRSPHPEALPLVITHGWPGSVVEFHKVIEPLTQPTAHGGDSGYSKQQSTRPQTLGYGLLDSPAAQCAWIVEKFWAWTDCDGHPENVLSRDELLDNVMLYWIPGAGASSARLYWESFRGGSLDPVTAPTGVSVFPK